MSIKPIGPRRLDQWWRKKGIIVWVMQLTRRQSEAQYPPPGQKVHPRQRAVLVSTLTMPERALALTRVTSLLGLLKREEEQKSYLSQ